jgi:hypothetical protein
VQRLAEQPRLDRPTDFHGLGDIHDGAAGADFVVHPQTALGDRQRQSIVTFVIHRITPCSRHRCTHPLRREKQPLLPAAFARTMDLPWPGIALINNCGRTKPPWPISAKFQNPACYLFYKHSRPHRCRSSVGISHG